MNNPLAIPFKQIEYSSETENIQKTSFPGLFIIERPVFSDDRGDFWEVARITDIEKTIQRPFQIQQINRSRNKSKGILRGIHVADWDKLILIDRGSAFVALVDMRIGSPTYGKTYTDTIGDGYKSASILVPAGFGNSYQTLSDSTDYIYAVSDLWGPGREVGINWNDPWLSISWPITSPILSEKDQKNSMLSELLPTFLAEKK